MMTRRDLLAAATGAALASVGAFALARSKERFGRCGRRRDAPVLCFGDSLTEGYFGVWHHPVFGVNNANSPSEEINNLRLHPYSIQLGIRLAADVGDDAAGYASSLKYASCRAYSGWTAQDLLPRLKAVLGEGPWRACVLLAGSNDIIMQGASATTAAARVGALIETCDAVGLAVVVALNPDGDLIHHGLVPQGEGEERRARIAVLAALLKKRCLDEGRPFVDLRSAIPMGCDAAEQSKNAQWWDDCIHPSPLGSDRIGDAVYEAIKKYSL